jgi:hypothetical protein
MQNELKENIIFCGVPKFLLGNKREIATGIKYHGK